MGTSKSFPPDEGLPVISCFTSSLFKVTWLNSVAQVKLQCSSNASNQFLGFFIHRLKCPPCRAVVGRTELTQKQHSRNTQSNSDVGSSGTVNNHGQVRSLSEATNFEHRVKLQRTFVAVRLQETLTIFLTSRIWTSQETHWVRWCQKLRHLNWRHDHTLPGLLTSRHNRNCRNLLEYQQQQQSVDQFGECVGNIFRRGNVLLRWKTTNISRIELLPHTATTTNTKMQTEHGNVLCKKKMRVAQYSWEACCQPLCSEKTTEDFDSVLDFQFNFIEHSIVFTFSVDLKWSVLYTDHPSECI